MMLRAVTLLPQPDAPTSPRVSPWATANEKPSTACTTPSAVLKWVYRLSTRSNSCGTLLEYYPRFGQVPGARAWAAFLGRPDAQDPVALLGLQAAHVAARSRQPGGQGGGAEAALHDKAG